MSGSQRFVTLGSSSSRKEKDPKEENKIVKNSLWARWTTKPKNKQVVLTEVVDIEQDFKNFKHSSLEKLRPDIIYQKGSWSSSCQLITKTDEQLVQVGDNEDGIISFITPREIQKLQKRRPSHKCAHIGLLIVGVKGLTKQELGAKTLLMVYDESIPDPEKKIIVYMEVDMSRNRGLFYCAPDILLPIKNLDVLKVGIQTKGYEPIERENLVIVTGFLGKTSSTTAINYKCQVDGVVSSIASKGVRFIQAEPISSDLYKQTPWPLDRILAPPPQVSQPTKGSMYKDSKGKLQVVFSDYEAASLKPEFEDD